MIDSRLAGRRTESAEDGGFSIGVLPGDTLRFRALGYRGILLAEFGSTPLKVALVSAPAVLSEMVVTASRRPQRTGETAVPVTTVDRQEIEATAAPSVDKVVGELPGLQILPNAPTGSNLSIRGIDGARVLVLIDGEPVSGSLLENRDLSRVSTAGVDRIEVVKGPLSALYGSDALGGTVNIVTQNPTGPLAIGVEATAGDMNRRDVSVDAQSGGTVSYRLMGAWRESGEVPSVSTATDALARVWDLRSSVRVAATSALLFRGDFSYLRERQRWRISSDGFNGFNDNEGATGWAEAAYAPGAGTLRTRVFFEGYTHRFRQAKGSEPIASDTAPTQRERVFRGNLGYNRRLSAHLLDVGMDVSHREIEAPGKIDGTDSDNTVEGYLQDGWTLGHLLLTPAARVSWNSRWGSAVTPSLASAWDASRVVRLRAAVGRGFRAPSFKELGWDFPNPFAGYTIQGNPDLNSERSWQVSAGASWAFAKGFVADVDGYRNDIDDLIELTLVGIDPVSQLQVFTPENVAQARTQGVELGLRWSWSGWAASAGYSYLDAKDLSTGQQLDRRATHSGRLRLGRAPSGSSGLGGDLTLGYIGSAPAAQPDGTIGTQDPLVSLDAQLRYDFGTGLGFKVGVDNLLDSEPAGWTGLVGRRIYAGIRTTWRPGVGTGQ